MVSSHCSESSCRCFFTGDTGAWRIQVTCPRLCSVMWLHRGRIPCVRFQGPRLLCESKLQTQRLKHQQPRCGDSSRLCGSHAFTEDELRGPGFRVAAVKERDKAPLSQSPPYRAWSSARQDFASQGTFGSVWRHRGCRDLGMGVLPGHPAGRDQGCC